jgi:3-hydroxy-3-methylglutaryl CoA synthase
MTALLSAVDTVQARGSLALCLAADNQAALAGSVEEITTGHAAAAVLLSPGPGLARLLGSASLTVDFVDHFRAQGSRFNYHWEERWVRDEGYLKLVPRLVQNLLEKVNLTPKDVTYFCVPCPVPGLDRLIAKRAGLPNATLCDQLVDGCGHSGAAHSVLMLVRTMQDARPGDRILVTAFGQGGDAALFEVTDGIDAYRRRSNGVTKWLGRGTKYDYTRYLALSGLLKVDRGIRAEVDKGTALSAAYRHSDLTLGLVGGNCERCGTRQIPRTKVCVNPDCGARNTQLPHSFAETRGRIVSWSADRLTYTPDPPAFYGMIDFDGGGRLLMDFTNVDSGRLEIGMPMRMVFRVKDRDAIRDFVRYFWKAAPLEPEEAVA